MLGRNRLGLCRKQLTPATRADFALDDFTRVRGLELHAAVAALLPFRLALIFRIRLAHLLLCGGLCSDRAGRDDAECEGCTCQYTRREMISRPFLILLMINSMGIRDSNCEATCIKRIQPLFVRRVAANGALPRRRSPILHSSAGLAPLLPGGRSVHCRGSTDIMEVGRLLQFVLGHADDRMIRIA